MTIQVALLLEREFQFIRNVIGADASSSTVLIRKRPSRVTHCEVSAASAELEERGRERHWESGASAESAERRQACSFHFLTSAVQFKMTVSAGLSRAL